MRFNRLSYQILAVFTVVIIVCLGASGWLMLQISEDIITSKISEGDRHLARRIAQEVEAEIASVKPVVTLLAESQGLRLMEATEVKREIDQTQKSFPEIISMYVADVEGEQIARTGTEELENVSNVWSFQVARGGDELISDIYPAPVTSEPMQSIALPIIDNGTVVGVVSADISFRKVMLSVMDIDVGKNGSVAVVAGNGRVVAHTFMEQLPELDLSKSLAVEAVLAGQEGAMQGYTDELGRQVLGSYSPIWELGWGVLIQKPLADIDAEVGQLRTTILWATIGAVLLAVLAGGLMSKQITKPIRQLASGSERVAQGDLSTLVEVKSSNEIGVLAYSFNQMMVSLKKSRDELEQRVVDLQRAEAERERLLEAERKQRRLVEALRRAGATLSSTLDHDEVLDHIMEQISQVVTYDTANIMLIKGDSARVLRGRGYEQFGTAATLTSISFNVADVPILQKMQQTGQPLAVPDVERCDEWVYSRPEHIWIKSFAGAPIHIRDRVIGFLNVNSATAGFFSQADAERLHAFADQAAVAIENAQLYDRLQEHAATLEQRVAERTAELQQRADELAALYKVGRDLAATLDLEVLLPAIAQRVTDALGADRCAIFLFDEEAGVLRARAAHGYMAERLADFGYRPGEEVVGQAYATGEPQYVPDLDLVPDLPRRDTIRAVLAVPLVSPTGNPLGVLSVTSLRPEAFAPDQQRLLETMAGQIARAIENARLYEETGRHATQLAALYEVGKEITSTLELDAMLQTIADDTARVAGADKCLILLIDTEKERLTRAVGYGYSQAQLDAHTFEEFQDGVSGWVAREKVSTLSADIQTDERNRGKALANARQSDDRSAAVAPLLIGDEVIGTLTVVNSRRRTIFTLADLNLVTMLAGQAASAIQNARLYQAAQEADRLKSAFLASMSHELRTPLNSIIGFTGIVLQGLAGPLNDEQTKQMGMVQSSARHLLNLINDVLDISKIEAGQLEVTSEPFDMREAIEKVVRTVMPLAEKKDLALVVEVAPEVGQITSDRRRVEQVLINLVNNAIKFTEDGEVRVECEVNDSGLVTRVVDTGIGIKPEDMGVLFEAFRQVDTGLARVKEGTGLGLSICKKLVGMLGGEIWVESEWGVGSTFTFTLPVKIGGRDETQDTRHRG